MSDFSAHLRALFTRKGWASLEKKVRAFTLMELLVVMSIIALLSTVVYASVTSARQKALVTKAGLTQKEMTKAAELYFDDMGFYPPDVSRGWDPGFERSLPWNPDIDAGATVPAPYDFSGTDCSHCPTDWQDIVAARWRGPYLPWPKVTPWGGRYDYNYWAVDMSRSGCIVTAGIYAGVQGDYSNNNIIPPASEQEMINKNFDNEACINGESQLLLWKL